MNKRELIYAIFVAAILVLISVTVKAQAATVPLPGPSHSTMVSWTAPSNCSSTTPCTFQVYRTTGTAACTVGSPGWTFVGTTAPQVGSYSDTTVSAGTTYTYAVYRGFSQEGIAACRRPRVRYGLSPKRPCLGHKCRGKGAVVSVATIWPSVMASK